MTPAAVLDVDVASLQRRQGELYAERDELEARQARLLELRREGLQVDDIDAAARQLVAGTVVDFPDVARELTKVSERLRLNAKALELIDTALGRDQLKSIHERATPLHAAAVAELRKFAKLVDAVVEQATRTDEAIKAFRSEHESGEWLRGRYPDLRAPYDDAAFGGFFRLRRHLVHDVDDPNRTTVEEFRHQLEERGILG